MQIVTILRLQEAGALERKLVPPTKMPTKLLAASAPSSGRRTSRGEASAQEAFKMLTAAPKGAAVFLFSINRARRTANSSPNSRSVQRAIAALRFAAAAFLSSIETRE